MKLGIIGLPGAGKSTFFNALTYREALNKKARGPNYGTAPVPDPRLYFLENMYKARKLVQTTIEIVDIPGLSGKSKEFLAYIREVDALIHVVRCFENGEPVSPLKDVETLDYELIFADLELTEKRIEKTVKEAKRDKTLNKELDLLQKTKIALEQGIKLCDTLSPEETDILKGFNLLTVKPVIYVANVALEDLSNNFTRLEPLKPIVICAQIEEELAELEAEERENFLADLNIKQSGLTKLIEESYKVLGLIIFLTASEKEVRSWTIKKNTIAKKAAGKIHSDIERGFIRAEVIAFDKLKEAGSPVQAKNLGLMRLEGKEYAVQDGDIIHFRFNV